ncbi:MAG: hypothetical protein MZV49_05195, partial [Rhodopseudomonas palustris]|nr:hypothetical protein [Rhodopseudomonas palustris]
MKAGSYTIVCDPLLAGVFIHEAFGHLSESDFIAENEDARKMMTLGAPLRAGLPERGGRAGPAGLKRLFQVRRRGHAR